MPLELTHSGQRNWKSAEKWNSLYNAKQCTKLSHIYGKGHVYLKALKRTAVLSDEAQTFCVVDSTVPDLAQVFSDSLKSAGKVTWYPCGRKHHYKKGTRVVEEVNQPLPSAGDDTAPHLYDVVIDNGSLDRESFNKENSGVKCRLSTLWSMAKEQLIIITLGHENLTREFLRLAKETGNEVTIVKLSSNLQQLNSQLVTATHTGPAGSIEDDYCPVPMAWCLRKSSKSGEMSIRESVMAENRWTYREAQVNLLRLPRLVKEWRMENFVQRIVPTHRPGAFRLFEIVDADTNEIHYTISMYDRFLHKVNAKTVRQLKPCVAVMVPLADDHHWLYRTPSGHQRLAEKAGTMRVLCVFLPSFKNLGATPAEEQASKNNTSDPAFIVERIRKDIGVHLLQLNSNPKKPVLLMTQQERFEDERKIVARVKSELQGEILVYDVVVDKHDEEFKEDPEADEEAYPVEPSEYFRRTLILAANPRVAQTEIWYKLAGPSDERSEREDVKNTDMSTDGREIFQFTHICHSYQIPILRIVLGLLQNAPNVSTLSGALLGIGGGLLPSLFDTVFGGAVYLECVDLDPTVVDIASKYFGFRSKRAIIEDGLKYVKDNSTKDQKLDFMIVDINGRLGETETGMEDITGPHRAFITPEFLHDAAACVSETGCVILNSVCQTTNARKILGSHLKKFYPNVASVSFGDELNVVYLCFGAKSAFLETCLPNLRAGFLAEAKKYPKLEEVVKCTPLYLGAGSKQRANVRSYSS